MLGPACCCLLLLLLLATAPAAFECKTSNCQCKWKSGKRWAECRRKGLAVLPEGLDHETQVLDLSHNNVQRLPRLAFADVDLVNLQQISLLDCRLQALDAEAFRELSNLVELNLSQNQLRKVPSAAFQHTPELRKLVLADNPIRGVGESDLQHLAALTSLDLSSCNIHTIAANAFDPLRMLQKLNLKDNRLTLLLPRLVYSLRDLHQISVEDNPWHCDCRLRKLHSWLVKNTPTTVWPVCEAPPRIKGESFDTLKEDQFACKPEILPTHQQVDGVAGENATAWCPVAGLPTPPVAWFVNDVPLLNGSAVGEGGTRGLILNEASEEQGSLLLLVGLTTRDSGLALSCQATNAAGTDSATFVLEVVPGSAVVSGDKIAIICAVLAVAAAVVGALCCFLARRRSSRSPVPLKTVTSVNGAAETRLPNLPYTPSVYVGGSVVAPSDNSDLLFSDRSDDECSSDGSGRQSPPLALNGHARSHAVSLDGAQPSPRGEWQAVWVPERVQAVLDSAAPEHVMQASLHEPLTPGCDALVQQRLLSSSQRHLNHRVSCLPDFAPDYSELFSFTPVGGGGHYTQQGGVTVPHYGTIPRSVRARPVSRPPGDGTRPTLLRHGQPLHYGSDGERGSGPPLQPLHGHGSKLGRLAARDSPDEGYQEGADL